MMRLNIIGCGRAGGTIASMLSAAGQVVVGQVLNRSARSTGEAVRILGGGEPVDDPRAFTPAGLWLIGTPDDKISQAAGDLASCGVDLSDSIVFHLSGRYGPDILDPAGRSGAELASVHPVRSMSQVLTEPEAFRGTTCVAEGSEAAKAILGPLFEAAGARWREVQSLNRGLYHASLSIISNVTKGVIWKAQKWLETSGLDADTAAEISRSLLSITSRDVFELGARHSITGPVVRGDTATVEAHLESLRDFDAHDAETYRVLARTVLDLANERGDLADDVLRRFEKILNSGVD